MPPKKKRDRDERRRTQLLERETEDEGPPSQEDELGLEGFRQGGSRNLEGDEESRILRFE